MLQSMLLVGITAVVTWLAMRWIRFVPPLSKALSHEEREIGRAKYIGSQLDGARDRATLVEAERNKVVLAKAVKAALWVTDARLNVAVPELLHMAQMWIGKSRARGTKWTPPAGVTEIDGLDDPSSPWASWSFDGHRWRIEAAWRPFILPDEIQQEIGSFKVTLDDNLVLDMTIARAGHEVMWIDALTVGPWVSDLLSFSGARTSDAKARSSARSAKDNQERADNIHWS